MAAVSNAYNLLHGSSGKGAASEGAWSTAGKKKRKGKAKDVQPTADVISPASSQNGLQVPRGVHPAPSLSGSSCSITQLHTQHNQCVHRNANP